MRSSLGIVASSRVRGSTNQFSTNFSGYTTGSIPSDWTARWATANVTYTVQEVSGTLGGKVLRLAQTADARRLISWDAVGTAATVEVLSKTRNITGGTVGTYTRIRGSGAAGAENSHDASHDYNDGGTFPNRVRLSRYLDGSFSVLERASLDLGNDVGAWLWARIQIDDGDVIRIRVWLDGTGEPGSWQITSTITTGIPATGWVGVGTFSNNHECDYFAVGLNGETAPSP